MLDIFAAIHWNLDPEIFSLGPIHPRWYGLLFTLCFIIGYQLLNWMYKIEGRTQKQLDSLSIFMLVSTVVGARLGHCLFYSPEIYLADPISILKIWEGGLASHGAAVGIIIAMYIYSKRESDIGWLWILDRVVVGIALAGLFIRLGNFMNSEILGGPSDLPWAVIFDRVDNIPRHPTQLYEAFSYLGVFGIVLFLYNKWRQKTPEGLIFGIFLILLFSARFAIEFFKEIQVAFEAGMAFNMGQLLSIPFIIAGIYFTVRALKKKD